MKGKRYFVVIAAVMIIAAAINVFGAGPAVKTDRVVYLINGALGDNAFYDSGEAGIKNIEKNYKVQTRTIECNFDAGKFQPALDAAVQYADVIFVISYGFEDQLMAIADKYPNKIFVNIDTIVENPKKTITSVFFLAEQSSYLAGMAAALTTTETSLKGVNKDKVIGVVGGDTDPIVSAFVFGYQQGAKAVDKNIKVLTKSLGGAWDDSAKGKQAALQLYDQKSGCYLPGGSSRRYWCTSGSSRARAICYRRRHKPERPRTRSCHCQRGEECRRQYRVGLQDHHGWHI